MILFILVKFAKIQEF